jgi:hypothetical protein
MKQKFLFSAMLVCLLAFGLTGCDNPSSPGDPTVVSVTVNSATTIVAKGATLQFYVTVTGKNSPAQTVTWSIEESGKVSETIITANDIGGLLYVATNERLTSLTVKATSTVDTSKSGSATVTITSAALSWTAVGDSTFGTSYIYGIAYGNGTFVAVVNGGKALHSANGENWTDITDTKFGSSAILGIAYGGNTFVAVGVSGKTAYSADNGATWTATDTKFDESEGHIYGIACGNSRFVAVGGGGEAAYSADGENWTAVNIASFSGSPIYDIAYGDSRFVAVGGGGKAAYSADGTTWTAIGDTKFDTDYTDAINGIAYGGGKFVAVGTGGKAAYSNTQE